MCSTGSVPLSKNSSMSASSPSAAISTSASWAFCAASAISPGISPSLPLPSPSGRIGIRFHADQVDDTFEIALRADGNLDGHGAAAEIGLYAFQGALKIAALASQLIDDDCPRQLEFFAEAPDLFRLNFHTRHAVHQDQRRIGSRQGGFRIVDENVVTGSIDDVDFGLLPLRHGDGSRDRDLALDFLFVKISDRIAFIHTKQAIGRSGGEKHTGGERRLAGIAVAHHTDVPNILAFVDFHGGAPFLKRNSNTGLGRRGPGAGGQGPGARGRGLGVGEWKLASRAGSFPQPPTPIPNPCFPLHLPADCWRWHTVSSPCGPIRRPAGRPPPPVSWPGPSFPSLRRRRWRCS